MQRAEIRLFVDRYAAAWVRADIRGLVACYTSDAVVESPIFHTVKGAAQIERSFQDLFKALGDWNVTIDEIVIDTEEGDRAVVQASWQFTHQGDMFGYPGTGRRVATRSATTWRFQDGLIARETRLYDFTGFLVQLGVLKAKGA